MIYVCAWSKLSFEVTSEDRGLMRGEVKWINNTQQLRGLDHGTVIVFAIPRRNYPRVQDKRLMDELYEMCIARQFDIIEHVMR